MRRRLSIARASALTFSATVLLVLSAAPAGAQVPDPSPRRLVTAGALDCLFTAMATGTWTNGDAVITSAPTRLSIGFMGVDTDDGTAEAVTSGAKSHITVRVTGNYLHLMQMEPYGAMYVTTVFATGTKNGRLQATHTRHEFTPVVVRGLTSRPEMYVGDCAATERKAR
jgi:hypothetical protein